MIDPSCLVSDWDGYGAHAIRERSIRYAKRFLAMLPKDISRPDLVPEPTGDLTMVWRKNGYHLIVGISDTGRAIWGGTTPQGHVHDDAAFHSRVPKTLLSLLYKIERPI
jgi:hypothetical protein